MHFISSFKKEALIFFYFLFLSALLPAQNTTHSTIDNLEVSYKDSDLMGIDSLRLVRAQSIITLKNDIALGSIHLKIIEESSNTVVYTANYPLADTTIFGSNNFVLFRKEGIVCYINSPEKVDLTTYIFEITTENSNGFNSEIFSEAH